MSEAPIGDTSAPAAHRLQAIVVAGILLASIGLAVTCYATRPTVAIETPEPEVPLIRVVTAERSSVPVVVRTHGTVAPRTESELVPEVSGRVVEVSPSLVSGGFFDEGDVLLAVDPRDYEAARERARAGLVRAESEQQRAARELARLEGLRRSNAASAAQLENAESAARIASAALREARSALEVAERDLARTSVRAPFVGRVREERVGVGQFVTRGSPVATLYAIDYAEVRLPVPDRELAYLELPLWKSGSAEAPGPEVRLSARFAGAPHEWRGRVVRTEGEIDAQSRMVHVVARVEDPYDRLGESTDDPGRPPLAVGLFVRAEIQGRRAEDVIVLPRAAVRPDDRVFVIDAEDRLEVRPVDVLRVERDRVLVRGGLVPGERVTISPLAEAVEGMRVRVSGGATS